MSDTAQTIKTEGEQLLTMTEEPDYGDFPNGDPEDVDSPIGASLGSGLANPKADLIEKIMANSTPLTPPSPTIGTPTTKTSKYDPEELAEKTVWELRRIYRDEKNTLPLSQRFDKKDRELAFRSDEYRQVLEQLDDPDDPDLDEIEAIDLTEEF